MTEEVKEDSTFFGGVVEGGDAEWKKRVAPAFEVVDAILRGVYLPEPTQKEAELLGQADYDPELRFRVARQVLEYYYGKPRQQISVEGTHTYVLQVPNTFPSELLPENEDIYVDESEVKVLTPGEAAKNPPAGGFDQRAPAVPKHEENFEF